jgi:hypothetical protein
MNEQQVTEPTVEVKKTRKVRADKGKARKPYNTKKKETV